MQVKQYGDQLAVRLDQGEELVAALTEICTAEKIIAGTLSGIGAANHLVLRMYDGDCGKFVFKTLDEPLEISSITGNISLMDGKVFPPVHVAAADRELRLHGGHAVECRVDPTAELFIQVIDGKITRTQNPGDVLAPLNFE